MPVAGSQAVSGSSPTEQLMRNTRDSNSAGSSPEAAGEKAHLYAGLIAYMSPCTAQQQYQ